MCPLELASIRVAYRPPCCARYTDHIILKLQEVASIVDTSQWQGAWETKNAQGNIRRVGFELEFSGVELAEASSAVANALGGTVCAQTVAEHQVDVPDLGPFKVEIDWDFLKRKARETAGEDGAEWVDTLGKVAPVLVPVEVVCPPIALNKLDCLAPMVDALRQAGAEGTEASLMAAYGVHINPEIPALEASVVHRYLRAFALLQWWLVTAHDVDPTRRLTPYIDPWPEAYLLDVLTRKAPTIDTLIDSYLEHNPTRNRALDMLPLFAEIDAERVRSVVDDGRIKARPTFHYRLPNCQIEQTDWSLSDSWQRWCLVETLAWDEPALDQLSAEFVDKTRFLIGVSQPEWTERMTQWLTDRGLA